MAVIGVCADVVARVGAVRALVIACLVERLRADMQRGAQWMQYADRFLSQDTGLSYHEAARARRWWQDVGVLVCRPRGMPRVIEYSVVDTLERWGAWCAANGIQSCASAKPVLRQRTTNFALARKHLCAGATTDHDQDDQEREIAALAAKNGWRLEEWEREAAAIRARCAARAGVCDLAAYTRAALIAAAQAGPRAASRPASSAPARRIWRRPIVTYTEAEREAARERARLRLAEIESEAEGGEDEAKRYCS